MKTLAGGDFSHWNKDADKYIANCVFFANKLTEGKNMVDNTGRERALKYAKTKPCILYHVITPKDSAKTQVENFCKQWDAIHAQCGALGVAIDVESMSAYFPYAKTEQAQKAVEELGVLLEERTKRRVIIYCGDLYGKSFYRMVKSHDWGLWIARYSAESKIVNTPDIWQKTSKPYDTDIFYGAPEKIHRFLRDWS